MFTTDVSAPAASQYIPMNGPQDSYTVFATFGFITISAVTVECRKYAKLGHLFLCFSLPQSYMA